MKVLVCGSRTWTNKDAIRKVIANIYRDYPVTIVQGGARGADALAREVALEMLLSVTTYRPEWKKYGRKAGPIRNQRMLDQEKPNLVLAFTDDLQRSKGTANMVRLARDASVQTWVVSSTGAIVEVS